MAQSVYQGSSSDARALRARLNLRHQYGREPSAAEVQKWLKMNGSSQVVTYATVHAAYCSGEEVRLVHRPGLPIKLRFCVYVQTVGFEVIKCIGYDVELARRMQVT